MQSFDTIEANGRFAINRERVRALSMDVHKSWLTEIAEE
jgi:hypothetical protein